MLVSAMLQALICENRRGRKPAQGDVASIILAAASRGALPLEGPP
jgi:hypothetical protein